MATPTEPITGALFRALRTTADPELARAAEEEIRQIAGQTSSLSSEPRSTPKVLGSMSNFLGLRLRSLRSGRKSKLKEPALTPKPHGLTTCDR